MKNLIYVTLSLFIFSGCAEHKLIDQQAEGVKLMEISRQWAKSKTKEELLSYWSNDALFIAPNQATLRGKAEISKMLEAETEIPGFEVHWEPKEVFVSKSGDLAYLIENLSIAMDDSIGNQITTFYKAVTIWNKQADGTWKCTVDTYNGDPSVTSLN